MKYDEASTAWAVTQARDAALYFDKVHILKPIWLGGNDELEEIEAALSRRQTERNSVALGVGTGVHVIDGALLDALDESIQEFYDQRRLADAVTKLAVRAIQEPSFLPYAVWAQHFFRFSLAIQCGTLRMGSVLLPGSTVENSEVGEPALCLANLRLVDTSRLTWDHILELRRDEGAVRSLRNLRAFLYKTYKDEPASFLRDDLARRVEEYEAASRKWALDTVDGAMSAMFDKDIAVSAAAALAALLLGMPVAAMVSAMPMAAKLGRVAIDIRTRRRLIAFEDFKNPVAFLVDLRARQDLRQKN